MDLISRKDAITVHCDLCGARSKRECDTCPEVEAFSQIPADSSDLSDYSDRLWKAAYEQGKEYGYLEGKAEGIKFFTDELKKINAHLSDAFNIAYRAEMKLKEMRKDG